MALQWLKPFRGILLWNPFLRPLVIRYEGGPLLLVVKQDSAFFVIVGPFLKSAFKETWHQNLL